MIIAAKLLLKPLGNIDIVNLKALQLSGNALIQVAQRNAKLLATGIIIERHRRLVVHSPLKIVG